MLELTKNILFGHDIFLLILFHDVFLLEHLHRVDLLVGLVPDQQDLSVGALANY
jgi:hypothetical protein